MRTNDLTSLFLHGNKAIYTFLAATALLLAGCAQPEKENTKTVEEDATAYEESINQWQQEREARLKAPDGWLTLAGLFWLKEGDNTFGSGKENDLVFPADKIPAQAGVITLRSGKVSATIRKGVDVKQGGQAVQQAQLYTSDQDTLPPLTYGTLTWFTIKRGDKYGIRLRDSENEALLKFKGIDRYPATLTWKVEAKLEAHPTPKQIPITNIVGQTSMENSPGTVVFTVAGKQHRLDALEEGDKLFIIFADKTNGLDTYGAGRYLYADKPGADGTVVLDFNKAYNPPCAFVTYATCPLPPRQNILSIPIPAGEKAYEAVD